ncbi:hypothetical protein LPJ63_003224 [Coemansia sp. RSA 2711]|nr:hypothetical protein LPJ63_003224 [Coemansia sp. RSA 2711]KAJ2305036.1 hypothetical protein IWW54_005203 [Coemansia sp. RSA 2705]KAJ2312075.1 hypothetical protein IWW52_004950 [Coemansia sp. RSA 2704]KAJ2368252.1 hypothetical protein H4S01_001698 [Coemansia sp. RSA 2610]KAJ2719552.1 hypothetical protein H4R23_004841 [Coemansia sp. Cherry 401B]
MLIDRVNPSNRVRAFGVHWPDALRYRGSVIRISFPPVAFMTAYGVGIAFLIRKYDYLAIPVGIMTPVAVVLSLLLVFRTNSAYDRYWEGRKIWQDLKVNARNLIRNTWCGVQEKSIEDSVQKRQGMKNIAAFMIAIKHYIRGEDGLDYADLDGLLSPEFRMQVLARRSAYNYGTINDEARNSPERGQSSSEVRIQQCNDGWERTGEVPLPSLLLYEIQKFVEYLMTNNIIYGQLYMNMTNTVNAMGTLLGGCERIISTPIPLAYHIHLHHSLYMYLLVLPWALGSMGLAKTIILQFVVSFMMLGIDAISREIQNPFGYDANDLDLDAFCEAMLVDLNYAMSHRAPKALEVVEDTLGDDLLKGKTADASSDAVA